MQSRTKKWLGLLAEGLGAATLLALAGCYATTRPGAVYTTEPEPVYYQPAQEQVRVQHRDTYYVEQPARATTVYVQERPAPATTVYVQERPAPATTVYVQPQQPPQATTVHVGAVHPQRGAPGHRARPGVVGQRGPVPAQGQGRSEDDDDDDHDDGNGNGNGNGHGRGHGRGRAPH